MEDCLAALRQEVDRLDDQIAELFLKRMEDVYKRQRGRCTN